jgi:hydroxymethylbilane synthase
MTGDFYMNYKIGTRGSKLALAQTEAVAARLREAYPMDTFEICVIRTAGDKEQTKPLSEIGSKGLFVTEIEEELLKGEIQLAVHSMKDMPERPMDGLGFADAWKREDPRDVLILREAASLSDLKPHAVIATGSKRRACALKRLREDLTIVDIRGNVDTRIRKMEEQKLDGLVLAAAGLKRLGREGEITQYLSPDEMIPAPAQGVLALEVSAKNQELLEKLNALSDDTTQREVLAERGFLEQVGGSCHLPVGAYAEVLPNQQIRLMGLFGDENGTHLETAEMTGEDPLQLASDVARMIFAKRK